MEFIKIASLLIAIIAMIIFIMITYKKQNKKIADLRKRRETLLRESLRKAKAGE